ncbi:MAG: thiamine pyrophosphate-dependent enzyme [Chloroflexota bacterium]|nr:thiamine pyrophosphate-dependent enzyme [Chloroflexota bacterium]
MAVVRPDTRRLDRLELTRRVVGAASDALIVAGIGNAGFDLATAGDRPENFYMLGSMGLGVPIGHGLALAQPDRPVVVLEGEGSVLMNLGALATVGREAPENLTIVIWDNEQWQLTGGQRLATASSCDLATVARGCGIQSVMTPDDETTFESDVRRALDSPGPHILVVKIDATAGAGRPHSDPNWHKYRFMQALGIVPD